MAITLFAGLLGVVTIAGMAFMVWALVEILRTDKVAWDASGMVQLVWVAVVLVLPVIGSVLFFAIARPRLTAVPA